MTMRWFLDMSMRTKLLTGFGLIIALLAVTAGAAWFAIGEMRESQRNVIERDFFVATNLLDIKAAQNRARALFLDMSLKTRRPEQEAIEREIQAGRDQADSLIAKTMELKAGNDRFLSRLGELKQATDAYRTVRDRQIAMIYDGHVAESRELSAGEQEARYEKTRSIANELSKDALAEARAAAKASEALAERSVQLITALGLVAVIAAVGMALLLHNIIVGPLTEMSGVARRIADGDLAVSLPPGARRDELGDLARTIDAMAQSLRRMIGDVTEGVGVLAAAASEITASTTQVAAGSAQAAVAVSQTTTTVEEVKQTAHVSAQKARHVSETAQKSVQFSQGGRRTVDESIEGMRHIQQQVDLIARSIVKLTEQSQAIGDIIASVNDLAEQSNLLAVNAAIEAAKAGDQGRGFAVVAQEIKSLAEQSKQATGQVRNILGEIQKATNGAVLATEQGTKAVEAGTRLASQLGESIRQLADSIAEASQAATQIAASAQQQLAGMDQVALAMQNINQASNQNVASTRQAESAAQNLHELGVRLKSLVARYAA
jgi:methyl-accepting chemotaxis protein